jgi:ABC-2 type transport system permease protein
VALYTLHERIGAEAVNGAVRRFLGEIPPIGTAVSNITRPLRRGARRHPPPRHPLLTDLFETITVWDVKTQSAASRRLPDGEYEVTLEVLAQKLRADGIGVEAATLMNDLVEVGVFASGWKTRSTWCAIGSGAASRAFASSCRRSRHAPASIRTAS